MIAKYHKQNTNFQILNFIAGSCYTPDGAYFLLLELQEEREAAIKNYEISKMRIMAKRIKIGYNLNNDDLVIKLEAEADLLEIKNQEEECDILYKAALDELNFIKDCINQLEPLRKFKYKSLIEAHEMSQEEEWRYELINRAENYIVTSGTIPADHFGTMRLHPKFNTEIFPAIEKMQEALHANDKVSLIKIISNKPKFLEAIEQKCLPK